MLNSKHQDNLDLFQKYFIHIQTETNDRNVVLKNP